MSLQNKYITNWNKRQFLRFSLWKHVMLPPSPPHTLHHSLLTIHFLAGDQLVVPRGVTHISCHYKKTIEETAENKTNEQTRTMLGVNSEQKESMQHYISDSIYGLTLAWITSENSTKKLECRHLLTRSSSLDPVFSTVSGVDRISPCRLANSLSARVSGVDCPCPWFHANCLSAPFSNQLSLVSPHHFRIRRDFRSKNPLCGFARKQTKESSAWRATYIVLQRDVKWMNFIIPVNNILHIMGYHSLFYPHWNKSARFV